MSGVTKRTNDDNKSTTTIDDKENRRLVIEVRTGLHKNRIIINTKS